MGSNGVNKVINIQLILFSVFIDSNSHNISIDLSIIELENRVMLSG